MGDLRKCSKCGQPSGDYASVLFASVFAPKDSFMICGRCAADDHAAGLVSIEEADHFIEETTMNLEKLEELIKLCPETAPVPEELEPFAMTPLKVYRALQAYLAAFKSRRMELMTEMGSEHRLQYEIRKAVDAENYELAAELKKQLPRDAH